MRIAQVVVLFGTLLATACLPSFVGDDSGVVGIAQGITSGCVGLLFSGALHADKADWQRFWEAMAR